jgi:nitrite reductase (NO-forming)
MKPSKHEKPVNVAAAEPGVEMVPVPVWIIFVFGLLFFWAENFLGNYGGEFNKQVYSPYKSLEEMTAAQPPAPGGKEFAAGKELYIKTAGCAACHQPTGMGSSSPLVPPLAGSDFVLAKKPDRLVHIVLNGLTGHIEVAGKAYDGLTMPPIGTLASLSNEQIAAVLTYIRGNKDWGNKASAVSPEDVKAVRAKITSNAPETLESLQRIPVD